jgi:hypothetical protein
VGVDTVGANEGEPTTVGLRVGSADGNAEGRGVGWVGWLVPADGIGVGSPEGLNVGALVGAGVGAAVVENVTVQVPVVVAA